MSGDSVGTGTVPKGNSILTEMNMRGARRFRVVVRVGLLSVGVPDKEARVRLQTTETTKPTEPEK